MELIEGIATVGFPIVSFLMMFWLVTKTLDQNTRAIQKLTELIHTLRRE